jgi:hypothetical protein
MTAPVAAAVSTLEVVGLGENHQAPLVEIVVFRVEASVVGELSFRKRHDTGVFYKSCPSNRVLNQKVLGIVKNREKKAKFVD